MIIGLWLRRDRVAGPLAFALASFLPASNLLTPIASLYAQNFLYLPLVGIGLALADLPGRAGTIGQTGRPGARHPRLAIAAAALALGLLACGSYREAGIWRDGPALFTAWTRRFPNYALAHQRLGLAFLETGQPAAAVPPLRKALALDDRNVETYDKLSLALMLAARSRSDLEESLEHNRTAVSLLVKSLAEARTRASQILASLGRPAEAEQEAREALRLDPGFTAARTALAESLFRLERYAEAAGEFKGLVLSQPDDPNLWSPYVVSLIHAGDLKEARTQAERARRAFPGAAWFDFCLARVEARTGHKKEALELLKSCAARDPATREWIGKVPDFDSYRGDREFDAILK